MLSPSRRLLIIDDEKDLLEILAYTCRPLTTSIECASDGVEAMNIIKHNRVDAILSDIMMPRMNGIQLFAQVRELGIEVPFIFLTGFRESENIAQALKLGANDFLEKPYDENKLLTYVNLALDLGSALNSLETELEFYGDSKVPVESLIEVKKARRELWKLKFSEEFNKIRLKTS